ncbi:MAG: hypothetical protein L6N96_01925 [Candidatus Methylarchaceae archaeon HK02M2]|nr:hypothetical protein [Candidatus Methylarchaceae archaeon HK02M2]
MVWSGYSKRTISWKDESIVLIDQRKLPNKLEFIECNDYPQIVEAIKNMAVRGAPAIGVAAAMALGLAAQKSKAKTKEDLIKELEVVARNLKATRPTGVNLFWMVKRVIEKAKSIEGELEDVKVSVKDEALQISEEDVEINHAIGRNGITILEEGDVVLTHCK